MFCVHCGKEIQDGALFCTFCGNPQQQAQQVQPLQQAQPVQPMQPVQTAQPVQPQGFAYASAPKKKNKGLLIGLISGCILLAAGIVVLILFLTGVIGGKSLPGVYQSIRVIYGNDYEFVDDDVVYLEIYKNGLGDIHTYDDYEYYSTSKNALYWDDGFITVDGMRYEYELKGDTLNLIVWDKDRTESEIIEFRRVDKTSVPGAQYWPR